MMHFLPKADLLDFLDYVLSHGYEQGRAAGSQIACFYRIGTANARGVFLRHTPGGYIVWGQGVPTLNRTWTDFECERPVTERDSRGRTG
jgi:hypothetical protein